MKVIQNIGGKTGELYFGCLESLETWVRKHSCELEIEVKDKKQPPRLIIVRLIIINKNQKG